MKIKNVFKTLVLVAIIGVTVTSCRKNKDDELKDIDTSVGSDNALAEVIYNDAHNMADQAATSDVIAYLSVDANNSDQRSLLSSCATVTRDTISVPHKITIDFTTTNCLCQDGRYRRGQVIVTYTGKYRDSASVHTISFNNYFVNDNKVLGTKTVTNNGHNSAGHLSFSIAVNGQIIKASGGGTITWTSNRTSEWIVGETTPAWSDDVYLITGSATGTTASGNPFTANITTALRKEIGCKHIVSGSIAITPSGKATRLVDYGNGACDTEATVTINGHVYTITLH